MLELKLGALSMQANTADVAPISMSRASRAAQAGAGGKSPGWEHREARKAAANSE